MSRLINIVKYRNEKTFPTQPLTIPDLLVILIKTKSWYLEDFDQDSISSQNLELDQYQSIDKLASFYFNEIELEHECDPDPQLYDSISIFESMLTLVSLPKLGSFFEPTLIPVSINFENEPPLLNSHISLMGKKCEIKFFDLDSTLKPKPTVEPKVDFPELILVPKLFISEPKSSIPQNNILLLDQCIDHNDLVMIFQEWSCKGNNFHDRILHDPIHIGDFKYVNRKEVNKDRFVNHHIIVIG